MFFPTSGITPSNNTLFQTFEWHTTSSPPASHETHSPGSHYARLLRLLPSLSKLGINSIWLPPGCKANWPEGNGYDCYDIWDLGEFHQKVVRSTKWGSREELRDLINAAHDLGLKIIWDAVLNHKIAGDAMDECWAVEVDPNDRRIETCAPKKITPWVAFDFHGRGDRYSALKWRAEHFNGTDWDDRGQKHAIFKIIDDPATYPKPDGKPLSRLRNLTKRATRPGKDWAQDVSKLHGNYDYLLFSNIYHKHPAVREDMMRWGEWMVESTQVDGFRLDAVQHYSYAFTRDWISKVQAAARQGAFIVGEVWSPEVKEIDDWLNAVGQGTYAFDSPLVYNFSRISEAVLRQEGVDLRRIANGTLLTTRPAAAVTVVANHDTQTGQASFSPMDSKLKLLFYTFTLMRKDGHPCVFWGDLFGIVGPHAEPPACAPNGRSLLPDLILARELFAYGEQKDVFDSPVCIAWIRAGTRDRPGCVALIAIQSSVKKLVVGVPGETWTDILAQTEVVIDRKGVGVFSCPKNGAAIYVKKDDRLTRRFPVPFDITIAI